MEILNYALNAFFETLKQLFVLFGPLLILAFIMQLVARENGRLGRKAFGEKTFLYVFGWLGTSIHELGHVVFAVIFAHKIDKIKLFTPHSGKSLGRVEHRYNSKNAYQTVGNFFIGIGPILLGTFLLYVISRLLFNLDVFSVAIRNDVAIQTNIFYGLSDFKLTATHVWKSIWECSEFILSGPNTTWWKLLLFFYLFYSIGSSITLSVSDIKGASKGFLYFSVLLLLFNLITLWMGHFLINWLVQISYYFSGFYFLILLSVGLNLVFVLLLMLIHFLKTKLF
jgi:hypothetical protein